MGVNARSDCKGVRVPNRRLRRAYLESGMTGREACDRLGWKASEISRVLRSLGLAPNGGRYNTHVLEPTALQLAEAFGLDPVDIGL